MNVIAAMSLAGTITMLLYYSSGLILRKRFGASQKDILLKAAVFFFLFPIQKIKYNLPYELGELLPGFFHPDIGGVTQFGISGYTAVALNSGEYLIVESWKVVCLAVGVCVALGFIGYQTVRYFRLKRLLGVCAKDISQETLENNPELRKLCGKKRIPIKKVSGIQTPFTLGVLRPVIFLPEQDFTQEEQEFVLFHEAAHIKRQDVLMKWISLLVILLHWFNPFSYLMLREINKVSEYRCDEETLRIAGDEKRGAYARLVVRAAATGAQKTKLWASCLSGSKKDISDRVEVIMDRRRIKRGLGIVIVVIAAAFSSFISTYAYETEKVARGEIDKDIDWEVEILEEDLDEEMEWTVDDNKEFVTDDVAAIDFTHSDCVFIDDITGTVSYLEEDKVITESERACTHTYKDGRKAVHKRDGKGGCEVFIYKTKKCIKCDHIIAEEMISSTKYTKCPH
ncbi:MAG: M56 family metallopeptidase [Lachnospiraceae bacterium]|uniref:M56 family metallopeptidase n=1 Tax=Parablautia sp. Marseille-Q6255 TaxID=3039593 RepID=UPI0024BCD335|nr:M56 family metallopeptidase [Parablautia sp. Marseille-Q6255]